MKILFAEKVSKYINGLTSDKNSIIINKLNEIRTKSKTEIVSLKEVVELSKNESIAFYAYFVMESTYVVFAFKDKSVIIVDIIELREDKIYSLTLNQSESVGEPTEKDM